MSSIDERIVRMQFDNAKFEQGVSQTLTSLEKLKNGLKLDGAAKGLSDIQAAGQKVDLRNVADGVESIASRFKAMSVVAISALASVASQAAIAGAQMVKSFTLGPLIDGFHEYETNLNSIQTILANTAAAGTNLKQVNAALNELNHYSDQTIYNFSEMARNIGTFTAAGVDLKTATASIKGIANLAALSGSNSEQAATAMYQLSQAISAGRVSLEDWNSVVNAGMGGTVFQRALAENAVKMGTLNENAVKLSGSMKNVSINGKSFRESITAEPGKESWLTSDVLTRTLSQFTGDLSKAELKAQGFNDAEIKAIQNQAKMAKNAATQVKTFSQLIGTLKESIGSGWAQTFQTIFGNFDEARTLFTDVSNTLGGFVQASANARNKVLGDWKELGGRTVLIKAISNAFHALVAVVKPIKDAFREIFPATTGKQLYDLTVTLRDFTEKLKIGGDTADKLKRTFAGVFAVFGIGWDILKEVAKTFFDLIGVATKGSGGFLEITAKIGDFLVALRKGIKEGKGIENLFKGIGTVLAIPIKLLQQLAKLLGSVFKGVDTSGVEKGVARATSKLDPLAHLGEIVSKVWDGVLKVMGKVGDFFEKLIDKAQKFGSQFADMFDGLNFSDVLSSINTGLFAGLVLLVKKFTSGGGGGGLSDIVDSITEGFEALTGALKGMQNVLNATALLEIAAAVGILVLSMNQLSKIDSAGLERGAAGIAAMFTQLLAAMLIFEKISGFKGWLKMPFIAGSMILLASAVLILTQACKQLAQLDWNELGKGLTGVTVLLGAVVATMKLMPNPAGMISSGLGMIALAAGIKILASAVTDLSGLGWEEMAKGLTGVAGILTGLALFSKFAEADKGGVLQGAGIILLATGIKILASALKDLSKFSWTEIGKGLTAMAGGLALIGAALYLIPPTSVFSAAGVLIVAASLGKIGDALKNMGGMGWEEIAKGLVALAGSLGIIAGAMILMTEALPGAAALFIVSQSLGSLADALAQMGDLGWGEIAKSLVTLAVSLGLIAGAMILMTEALPGAAALLVVATALTILSPVLQSLGEMSWGEIFKALVTLTGLFVVLGAAGLLLAPITPILLALGVAVTLLGVGMLAAGAGVLLFATGLTALAAAGAAGAAAIVGIVSGLIGLIPKVMEEIGKGLVAFAKVIATAGPAITNALVTVLDSLITAIGKMTPKIVNTLLKMLTQMLQTMAKYVPKMVDAGLKMLTGILHGIANNIGKVVDEATNVCVNFINGIARNLPKILNAGANLIIKFVNGLADTIRKKGPELGKAGGNLASAIIEGMAKGLANGVGVIVNKAKNLASSALNAAKGVLGIHSPSKEFEKIGNYVNDGFRKGLDGNKQQIDDAFKSMADQLKALSKNAKATAKERAKAADAYSALVNHLDDEHAALDKLSAKYDEYTTAIDKANQSLQDAIKTRDDYNKSITDQYSDMAAINADTTEQDYITNLKKQIEDTKEFANALQRARDLGLNDETYQDLLQAGPSSLPFLQDLLEGGKAGIDQLNDLGKQLDEAGASLGKQASSALYQAGVDSAQGLVDGLKKQQAAIEKQMDQIADAMVKAIKKHLGIHSPSKVFAEIGGWSTEGLAKGLKDTTNVVEKSATEVGGKAVDSLRKSLSNMADMVTAPVDLKPTITPVLDLSSVKKDAGQIGSLLSAQQVAIDSAYAKAKSIADSRAVTTSSDTSATTPAPSPSVTYNQYNNSPKALTAAEIYRQTNNQLSRIKEALG